MIGNKWVQFAVSFLMAGVLGAGWGGVVDASTATSIVGIAVAIEGVLHLTRKPA